MQYNGQRDKDTQNTTQKTKDRAKQRFAVYFDPNKKK
jgi:hypothetical protein